MMLLTLLSTLFLTSAEVTTTPQATAAAGSVVDEIAAQVPTIQNCSEKIWPSLKVGKYPLYVADYGGTQDLKSIFKINGSTGSVQPASEETTKHIKEKKMSPFFVNVPGEPHQGVAVSVNVPGRGGGKKSNSNETSSASKKRICEKESKDLSSLTPPSTTTASPASSAVNLLMHEAFHNVDQTSTHTCHQGKNTAWQGDPNSMLRELDVDEKTSSDVIAYRASMLHYLRKATENPSQKKEFLAKAAAWYHKWKRDYPETIDKLRAVDRTEGAASYVGFMSAAVGAHGCRNNESVRSAFLQQANSKIVGTPMPPDTQSYGLGAAAGYFLDDESWKDKKDGISWKKKVAGGKTPMELLAEQFPSDGKDPVPVPEVENGKKIFTRHNDCVKKATLSSVQEAYSNPADYVAVAVPITAPVRHPASKFSDKGKTWQLTSYSSNNFKMENWPQSDLKDKSCGSGNYSVVLVPKSSLVDGQISADSAHGSLSGAVGSTPAGKFDQFPLYCAP